LTVDLAPLRDWATSVRPSDIPPDVRRLARLQHLAAAPLWAAASGRVEATGGEPFVLGGRVSLGALPALWTARRGTVGELLAATVVANEVGARYGLAGMLCERALRADPSAADAAALAARARAEGGDPVPTPVDEAWWSSRGALPLPGAFGGAGRTWLSRTLVVPRVCAHPWDLVAVEAVEEILKRHLKAADKRLRADQVERIQVRLPWLGWGRAHAGGGTLARRIGVLVSFHALGPAELDDSARAEEVDWVESTVHVEHDWTASLRVVGGMASGLSPLFGGAGWSTWRAVRARTKQAGGWPGWDLDDLGALLRARPDRELAGLRGPAGDLGAVDLGHFRWCLPVEVKLYTTRGGWWPERRSAPEGTGEGVEAVARARNPSAAEAVLALPEDAPAAELCDLLGAPR